MRTLGASAILIRVAVPFYAAGSETIAVGDVHAEFGVEVIDMRAWQPGIQLAFQGPLYLSVDMDALDPAFAPGVSHHEPGGLDFRQLLDVLWNLDAPVVGGDIVEYNPDRDIHDMTCAVVFKLIKELSAVIAGSRV